MARFLCLATVVVALVAHPNAIADTLVAPNSFAATEATSDGTYPLIGSDFGTGAALHYQQVFSSSQFTAFGSGGFITDIAFRPDKSNKPGSISYSAFTLSLSTTAKAVEGLSSTFALNNGADIQTVYSGSITFTTTAFGTSNGPQAFDFTVPLQTPFRYNPRSGNLLLDLRLNGPSTNSNTLFVDAASVAGDSTSSLVAATGYQDPNGTTGRLDTSGAVVQFAFQIPEPSASAWIVVVSCGTALIFGVKRYFARLG